MDPKGKFQEKEVVCFITSDTLTGEFLHELVNLFVLFLEFKKEVGFKASDIWHP